LIKFVIFGGKGGGTLAAHTVQVLSRTYGSHQLIGYLNDRYEIGTPLYGATVIGRFDDWRQFDDDVFFVAPLHKAGWIQRNARRIMDLGVPPSRWASLIDPLANKAENTPVGGGSIVSAIAQVGPDSSVGCHSFLRPGAIVSHDVEVSDFVFLGQTSVIGGYSRAETGVHIAPGAIIRDEVTVGRFALVAMGAVVTKNVPPFAIVRGVPARITGYITAID
jgi:carbonic anhydrase/acetyltransferase-like protein (isoleucine patch superfamily)